MSFGLSIVISDYTGNTGISDHLFLLLSVAVLQLEVPTCPSTRRVCRLTPSAATQYSVVFKDSLLYSLDDGDLNVECIKIHFNSPFED